uniref:Uncharacterized protein n=1 Tax=Timema poppense TaxID=170557 RepID=A0A7R9HF29_TIMPO|nr:unnamed protein product [Timema poppensis]
MTFNATTVSKAKYETNEQGIGKSRESWSVTWRSRGKLSDFCAGGRGSILGPGTELSDYQTLPSPLTRHLEDGMLRVPWLFLELLETHRLFVLATSSWFILAWYYHVTVPQSAVLLFVLVLALKSSNLADSSNVPGH